MCQEERTSSSPSQGQIKLSFRVIQEIQLQAFVTGSQQELRIIVSNHVEEETTLCLRWMISMMRTIRADVSHLALRGHRSSATAGEWKQ